MLRRMISCLLVIIMVLTVVNAPFALPVDATDGKKAEAKVFDTATESDDFADDCVMVILNRTASLQFRSYTEKDFPEIACKTVENLSTAAAEKVQAKLRGETLTASDVGTAFMNKNINIDTYRTILCLELETPGKGNVLQAVRALEQREDIYYVGPNYNLP